jgi:Mg-chelatase subunit ChlI
MSVRELQERLQQLPPEQLRQFADWWDSQRDRLLPQASQLAPDSSESATVRTEMLRRKQDYHEHPERFIRVDDDSLKAMFDRIADARAGHPSAG